MRAAGARAQACEPIDWQGLDVVVFDVDGTLYDQARLRLAMLGLLLQDALRSGSLDTLRTLRTFRQVRERLADMPAAAFMAAQYTETARLRRIAPAQVQALATDWLEERPLAGLRGCRVPHVDGVFRALRAAGKHIAVLSDYPAAAKLQALELQADTVVCANDIGRLKPDPAGLQEVLRRAGAAPHRALMIGDRADRDGAAAARAGVPALIRARRPLAGHRTFRSFDDPVFAPLAALAGEADRRP